MTEKQWLDNFSEELKARMEEYGYNQRELANKAGLSESTICNYLNKRQIPKATALLNITVALDCDFATLMDFGEEVDF